MSIHNRLRTYQVSSPPAPPSSPPQLAIMPSPASAATASSTHAIVPETLIQCQQIVKVIVMDSAGQGHVQTFLSQNPTHRLIQSAVSTPTRSPESGVKQPPLPPPPPPYHHKHQFCPPTPPPPPHLLSQRRYSSGTRSLVWIPEVNMAEKYCFLYSNICSEVHICTNKQSLRPKWLF